MVLMTGPGAGRTPGGVIFCGGAGISGAGKALAFTASGAGNFSPGSGSMLPSTGLTGAAAGGVPICAGAAGIAFAAGAGGGVHSKPA